MLLELKNVRGEKGVDSLVTLVISCRQIITEEEMKKHYYWYMFYYNPEVRAEHFGYSVGFARYRPQALQVVWMDDQSWKQEGSIFVRRDYCCSCELGHLLSEE